MTLSDATYLSQALEALEGVETDPQLVQWMDDWMASEDYARLDDKAAIALDEAYKAKLAHIWPVGLGG